jgi:hypothetical protein
MEFSLAISPSLPSGSPHRHSVPRPAAPNTTMQLTLLALLPLLSVAAGRSQEDRRSRHAQVARRVEARNTQYKITDKFQGQGFFECVIITLNVDPAMLTNHFAYSNFNFFTGADPTSGQVDFLSESDAKSNGLAYVQSDNTTVVSLLDVLVVHALTPPRSPSMRRHSCSPARTASRSASQRRSSGTPVSSSLTFTLRLTGAAHGLHIGPSAALMAKYGRMQAKLTCSSLCITRSTTRSQCTPALAATGTRMRRRSSPRRSRRFRATSSARSARRHRMRTLAVASAIRATLGLFQREFLISVR